MDELIKSTKRLNVSDLFEKMILEPVKVNKSTESSSKSLFDKILDCLDLKERCRLRSVSKRWCELIDNRSINRLLISQFCVHMLMNEYRIENMENFLQFDNLAKISSLIQMKSINLSNLKSLTIGLMNNLDGYTVFFDLIKNSLVDLKIFCVFVNEIKLDLPKLSSLVMKDGRVPRLVLNTPNLIQLKIWQPLVDLKLEQSTQIRTIELLEFNKFLYAYDFQDLSYLCIFNVILRQIGPNFFKKFMNLKQLHLYSFSVLEFIYNRKQKLRLDSLSIFIEGIRVDNLVQTAMLFYQLKDCKNLSIMIPLIKQGLIGDKLHHGNEIFYSEIEDIWMKMDAEYFEKYNHLCCISLSETVKDNEKFLKFLKLFKYLSVIIINKATQSLELLDQIPQSCPYLQTLKMNNANSKDASKYSKHDYKAFKHLICVIVNGLVVLTRFNDKMISVSNLKFGIPDWVHTQFDRGSNNFF